MIGEDGPNAHERGMIDRFVAQGRERAMRMDEFDPLANQDVAEVREEEEEIGERRVGCDRHDREVIYLET